MASSLLFSSIILDGIPRKGGSDGWSSESGFQAFSWALLQRFSHTKKVQYTWNRSTWNNNSLSVQVCQSLSQFIFSDGAHKCARYCYWTWQGCKESRVWFARFFENNHSLLLRQVQDKFCLDLSEEQAIQFFQSLIDESVNAMFAVMVERIHKWAQVVYKPKRRSIFILFYIVLAEIMEKKKRNVCMLVYNK